MTSIITKGELCVVQLQKESRICMFIEINSSHEALIQLWDANGVPEELLAIDIRLITPIIYKHHKSLYVREIAPRTSLWDEEKPEPSPLDKLFNQQSTVADDLTPAHIGIDKWHIALEIFRHAVPQAKDSFTWTKDTNHSLFFLAKIVRFISMFSFDIGSSDNDLDNALLAWFGGTSEEAMKFTVGQPNVDYHEIPVGLTEQDIVDLIECIETYHHWNSGGNPDYEPNLTPLLKRLESYLPPKPEEGTPDETKTEDQVETDEDQSEDNLYDALEDSDDIPF